MNKQSWGIGWIWGGAAVAGAFVASACGDAFSGGDCRDNHTCAVAAGGDDASEGGSAGADRSSGGDAMTAAGQNAGVGADDSGGAGAVGGAGAACAAECSNGDPADGEETCEMGACVAGNPPPTVVSVTPGDEAADVELDTKIVIEFSEPLDPKTVTAANIQILDGTSEVAGELVYAAGKVTFTPADPLALLAPYTVSVTTGVTDEEGAAMLADATSRFTTREGAWKAIDVVKEEILDTSTTGITAAGEVLLTWVATDCPVSARWFQKGAAVAPATILSPPGEKACGYSAAAANAAGVASVVWSDTDATYNTYNRQYRDGAWSAGAQPLFSSDQSSVNRPLVAPNGVAMLWRYANADAAAKFWISDASGAWPAQATTVSTERTLPTMGTSFDAEGNALALWPTTDGLTFERIVASRFTIATAKWTTATELTGSLEPTVTAGQKRGAPAVAMDSGGDGMAVWVNASSGSRLMASRFSQKTGWAEPEPISGDLNVVALFERPGLVFDGHDFVAAWTANDAGKYYTYTARYDLKAGWTAYEKQQTVAADGTTVLRTPRLVGDGRGNLMLLWAKGVAPTFTLVYQRYSSGAWGPITAVPGGTISSNTFITAGEELDLSMNASGLAALSWANYDKATGYITTVRLASFF
jgi:hypothetical protein